METLFYILAIIGSTPEIMRGLKYIAKRTKTKKDDEIIEKADKVKS